MNSLNLNYLRGLYDYLFDKSDEELEGFDINSPSNRAILFEEMQRTFSKFGPISRASIVDGISFILVDISSDDLWRNAIPHDLPLNRVADRRNYLEQILFSLTRQSPSSVDVKKFVLVDEVGLTGLDYSK